MLKFEFSFEELQILHEGLVQLSYLDKQVVSSANSPELRNILMKELGQIADLSHKILFEGESK